MNPRRYHLCLFALSSLLGLACTNPSEGRCSQDPSLKGCASIPVCGNGARESGEQCDGTDFGDLSCSSFSDAASGMLACSDSCSLDLASCVFLVVDPALVPDDPLCAPGTDCVAPQSVIGALDWVDVDGFAWRAETARNIRASGRINITKANGNWRCSATLIDRDLIITNNHCVADAAEAATVRFYPRTESSVPPQQMFLESYECPTLVATDCSHDVSILRCLPNPASGQLPGEAHGIAPVQLVPPEAQQQVYLLHTNCDHRNGASCAPIKLFSAGHVDSYGPGSFNSCRDGVGQARHTCDSLGGSSGGGVFEAGIDALIAVHWGGTGGGAFNRATSLAELAATNPDFASILVPLAGARDCVCHTEGETRTCGSTIGTCQSGVAVCDGCSWSVCVDGVDPVREKCDGLDNNCNGRVDELCASSGALISILGLLL